MVFEKKSQKALSLKVLGLEKKKGNISALPLSKVKKEHNRGRGVLPLDWEGAPICQWEEELSVFHLKRGGREGKKIPYRGQ